jgi:hypothetical protein
MERAARTSNLPARLTAFVRFFGPGLMALGPSTDEIGIQANLEV